MDHRHTQQGQLHDEIATARRAAEAGAVVGQDAVRQSPPPAGGVHRGLRGDSGRTQARLHSNRQPGVVVEHIHDPDLGVVGQRPPGGVDLPAAVGIRVHEPK